mgnify:CR=1 FL=1
MKAIINSTALGKQLQRVTPVVSKNTVLPILSSVRLDFQKNKLTITATDLETTIQTNVECDTKKPFTVLMEFQDLANLCSKISDQPITIEETDNGVTIVTDNSKFKFVKSGEVAVFPSIPEDDYVFDYEAESDFFWAMSCANKCRSVDDLRANMNAVCIELKKDSMNIVSTDAFVFYCKKFPIKSSKQISIMVCDKFINMIKSFPDGKISIGERFIKVQKENEIIISRLKDAKFVNYEVIVPTNPVFNFKANRKDFISSIDLASVAANLTSKTCKVDFTDQSQIKITSQDIDFGKDGEINFFAENSVDFASVGINGSQMLKILNLFDTETVEMQFETPQKIIAVKSSEEENTLCLIQPVFVN